MRREERVTVQGPVKKQQPDGMSHRGSNLGWPTAGTVRRFRPRSQRTFFFCMDPLANDGSQVSSSFQDWPAYGAPLVRTWPFQAGMGWLKNRNFWVTSDNLWDPWAIVG